MGLDFGRKRVVVSVAAFQNPDAFVGATAEKGRLKVERGDETRGHVGQPSYWFGAGFSRYRVFTADVFSPAGQRGGRKVKREFVDGNFRATAGKFRIKSPVGFCVRSLQVWSRFANRRSPAPRSLSLTRLAWHSSPSSNSESNFQGRVT